MAGPASILIVDDDPGVRFVLEETLARDGHQVTTVESGEAALQCIAAQPFDLALVDLKLGQGIDGLQVLAELRQKSPDTIVIILTAHATLETAIEALRQGAHDYLFKPCQVVERRESVRTGLLKRQQAVQQRDLLSQLTQRLAEERIASPAHSAGQVVERPAAFRTGAEPLDEQVRFLRRGGLIIDLMRHVITLDGRMLELSPTEFALVAYLASEAPRVISHQELVRAVQGYECAPWEARETLRYHIHRIRQKIRQATSRTDVICTVRGIGYTLCSDPQTQSSGQFAEANPVGQCEAQTQ